MATNLLKIILAALTISGSLLAADQKPAAGKKLLAAKTAGPGKLILNYDIPLWPEGKVPLATGTGPLDTPYLTVFLPSEEKRNGTSMVVAPGGGNIMLMYGAEGVEIAERLNEWGITASC